jgi:CheY-like chemotaxis protein
MTAHRDFSALTALVADAHRVHRKVTGNVLRAAGVRKVLFASDAQEALNHVRRLKPDIVLLEWLTGPMNALDFIRETRLEDASRALPILMLSNRRRRSDIETARMFGASDYLTKPVFPAELAAKIAEWVPPPMGARRAEDPSPAVENVTLEGVRAALRRARAAALQHAARALRPDDPASLAAFEACAAEFCAVAEEIGDRALALGAGALRRYLECVGERLDPGAVRAHVHALDQLAQLPIALERERDDLAASLTALVDTKLAAA